jgi:predicted RNA polymerase sigma factor
LDQDRRRWDRLHIRRGDAALARAEHLSPTPGPYALQAAIAFCHARAFRAEETDWQRLAHLYELLAITAPSPIVELNRAVAVSMAAGPAGGSAAGLALVDQLAATGTLDRYHLLYSVRGDLLERLGRHEEAAEQFARAAALATNAAEKRLLLGRVHRHPQPLDH